MPRAPLLVYHPSGSHDVRRRRLGAAAARVRRCQRAERVTEVCAYQHPPAPRPPAVSLPVPSGGCRRPARARAAPRGGQERHGQRGVLPGALPGHAADAGRADDGGAGPGRRRCCCSSATAPRRTCSAYLRGVDNAKFRRQVVPGRSAAARGDARPASARRWCGRTASAYVGDQVVAEGGPAAGAEGPRRRSIRARSSIPTPRSARARSSARTRRSARTCASGSTAGSARRPSSTAGPRSATRRRCSRSRRSG